MSFAKKIKALRADLGLSQDALGELVGVHGRHIAKYEAGRALPNAETLVRIAQGTGVSIDALLLDDVPATAGSIDSEMRGLLRDVAELPDEDREVVRRLIEAFVKKRQMEEVLGTAAE